MLRWPLVVWGLCAWLGMAAVRSDGAERKATASTAGPIPAVTERYADEKVQEVPHFRRHVVPLLGRLGCNGRACHGSLQGRGGFRLSLFGYDFLADHQQLLDAESPRVNTTSPLESLILVKPTDADQHEGGQRYVTGSWQYHLLRRWIEAGAKYDARASDELVALELSPADIFFEQSGQQQPLQAVAVWADGTREDVTPLCRFQSNDAQVATVDESGMVTGGEPGDTHIIVFYDKAVIPVSVTRPVGPLAGAQYPHVAAATRIDQLVLDKLHKLGIVPAELCDDDEFLRRVRLDLTGTLPTVEEVQAFLADTSADKRERKIDELLETPAYAAWWATKLCDFTGNSDAQTINATVVRGQASQDWYDWMRRRVEVNTPYDRLVEGIVLAKSREDGESYYEYCEAMTEISRPGSPASFADRSYMPYYWARRDFRKPAERAISFAYAFLGVRIECAQCHKHPFDEWSDRDFAEFSKFFGGVAVAARGAPDGTEQFAQILNELGLDSKNKKLRGMLEAALKEEKVIPFSEVFVNVRAVKNRRRGRKQSSAANRAVLLGGETVDLTSLQDYRQPLMDWLRREDNPYFARALVNRVWAAYFGVGIVEPPDDHSLANPPSNAPLLDYLARGFIENHFDMKWVHREILKSHTYQRSWRPNETNAGDRRNFSRAVLRRLPAEVAYDALQQATAGDAQVADLQVNMNQRAIALTNASPRANRGRIPSYALNVFGRSSRESNCDCDRSADPSLLQTVYLQNDQEVLRMLNRPQGWIQQVAQQRRSELAARKSAGDSDPTDDELLAQRLTRQIRRLKRSGEEQRIDQLTKRLKRVEARIARQERDANSSAADVPPEEFDAREFEPYVEQAYLRSLSRYPEPEELDRALRHIAESSDEITGLRDVMWALLNTKEFIVNH